MAKKIIPVAIALIAVAAIGGYFAWQKYSEMQPVPNPQAQKASLENFDGRLRIYSPKEGSVLGSLFDITGYAQDWFEGNVPVKVEDSASNILYNGSITVPDNYGKPQGFSFRVVLNKSPTTAEGKIVFNDYSAKDGKLLYQKEISIKFIPEVIHTANWKTYTNNQYEFAVDYPLTYQISDTLAKEGFYKETISKIVSFTDKENYIDDSTFSVYADNASSNLSTCLKDYNGEDLTKTKEINGNVFYIYFDKVKDAAMGGAMGSLSQYRVIHNNYCYILDSHIYWHNAGFNRITSSSTLEETQAQNDAIKTHSDFLDKILFTFRFIQ